MRAEPPWPVSGVSHGDASSKEWTLPQCLPRPPIVSAAVATSKDGSNQYCRRSTLFPLETLKRTTCITRAQRRLKGHTVWTVRRDIEGSLVRVKQEYHVLFVYQRPPYFSLRARGIFETERTRGGCGGQQENQERCWFRGCALYIDGETI